MVFLVGFTFALLLYNYFTANIISTFQTAETIDSIEKVALDRRCLAKIPFFAQYMICFYPQLVARQDISLVLPDNASAWQDVLRQSPGQNVKDMIRR